VKAVVSEIRAKKTGTRVSVQMSFNDTPPETMISVMHEIMTVVDGIYLAYPEKGGGYESPMNLDHVLAARP
jgi:hypothetical protein